MAKKIPTRKQDSPKPSRIASRAQKPPRTVALHADLSLDLPLVLENRSQLQQVVLNLLVNSRDAMAPVANRSRELLITSQPAAGGGGVMVTVKDSGMGIKPQDLHNIFESFFTTKPQGMGFGLSISRSIIEAHGGRIWATPNEGPGLTVEFSLPAAVESTSVS